MSEWLNEHWIHVRAEEVVKRSPLSYDEAHALVRQLGFDGFEIGLYERVTHLGMIIRFTLGLTWLSILTYIACEGSERLWPGEYYPVLVFLVMWLPGYFALCSWAFAHDREVEWHS